MDKLFIFNRTALIAALLPTFGLLTNCANSPVIKTIAVNQSNETGKKPMNAPPTNSADKDKFPAVDLSKIPTISYCDLIKNARNYDKKIVRVRAIHFSSFEQIYIYDNRCEIGQPPSAPEKVPAETWAQWDKSFDSKGNSPEAKLNQKLNGFGRKDVTIVGIFYSTNEQNDPNAPSLFGHMNCCRYQLSIMRVEAVRELDGETAKTQNEYGKTVKFAPLQKIEFADFTLLFQKDFKIFVAIPQPGQKLPTYGFKIEKGNENVMVYPNSDEADISPLKFEIGGKRYQLESGITDQSGQLAKDELIVRKLD